MTMEANKIIKCGDDELELINISSAIILCNDRVDINNTELTDSFLKEIETLLNKYWYEIANNLPKPHKDIENKKRSKFTIGKLKSNGDADIVWNYYFNDGKDASGTVCFGKGSTTHSLLKDIMPVIKRLSMVPRKSKKEKKAEFFIFLLELALDPVKSIYHDNSQETPEEMQSELSIIYDRYMTEVNKLGKNILIVYYNDSGHKKNKGYIEEFCGFDIFEKEKEINSALEELRKQQEKIRNSNNRGEKDVGYHLKWITKSINSHIVLIEGDCESKYRYNCILLCNPSFLDDSQEYDHVLVTPAGVVIIETKDWKGLINITQDGKWIRHKDEGGSSFGVASPISQMRRHQQLMESILPSVPVYSILCFSNPSAIVKGKENIAQYRVINIEQLEDTLSSICEKGKYSDQEINSIVATIEAYKVNRE